MRTMPNTEAKVEKIFKKYARSKNVIEAVLLIENSDASLSLDYSSEAADLNQPFVIASVTKLWTTAVIMQLIQKGRLSFNTPLRELVPEEMLDGLHIFERVDYTDCLKVKHLLFQTSGLPDPFEEGRHNLKRRVLKEDFAYSLNEGLAMVKDLKPAFLPGTKGQAHYSDINFDLLGYIIEQLTGQALAEIFRESLFQPLGLKQTYLLNELNAAAPPVYYKKQQLDRPLFLRSSGTNGGGVSTVRELMIFLKTFFSGRLFGRDLLAALMDFNALQADFGPIQYGGGLMRIPLASLYTLFQGQGELLGHTGTTGAFAFYYPQRNLFIAGNLAQMAQPSLPLRMMMQLAIALK